MTYITAIFITIVCCVTIVVARKYLQQKAAEALEYKIASDGFFESIQPLVKDDETPDEILETIHALSETITSKKAAWFVFSYLTNGRWQHTDLGTYNKILSEFFHRRPELEPSYMSMLVNWFRAVTSLSPIIGAAVRTAMTEKNLKRAAAEIAKSRTNFDHNNSNVRSQIGVAKG